MVDANAGSSPLERAAGAGGSHAVEAFKLLGNETRLSILLALWEATEPGFETNAVPFSELYDRVGYDDTGNFNYHLGRLVGPFVEETDEGYRLRNAGHKIVRAVVAGAGLEDSEMLPTPVDIPCQRCGERSIEVSYRDEAVIVTCRSCEGIVAADDLPEGTIAMHDVEPAGLAGRSPDELNVVGTIREKNRHQMMKEDVCPDCSGRIETSLHLCAEHTAGVDGICPECGRRDSARVRYVCTVCKQWTGYPIQIPVIFHPAVVSFYYERGVDMRLVVDDVAGHHRVVDLLWRMEHELVSTEPVRIRITVPCDGDELELTLDGDLDTVDVTER